MFTIALIIVIIISAFITGINNVQKQKTRTPYEKCMDTIMSVTYRGNLNIDECLKLK
jgi:hypothetical protein